MDPIKEEPEWNLPESMDTDAPDEKDAILKDAKKRTEKIAEMSRFFKIMEDDLQSSSVHHHRFYVSHNLANAELVPLISTAYAALPVDATLPVPFTEDCRPIVEDVAQAYKKEKSAWKERIQRMKDGYKKMPKKRRIADFDSTKPHASVPLYLVKFTRLLDADPDPYFDSDHNWYYMGNGNLSLFSLRDKKYSLKAVAESCYVQDFPNRERSAGFTSESKNFIHECSHSPSNVVAVRQRKSIKMLNLTDEDESLRLNPFDDIKSIVPITSIHLDERGNVCYACANNSVNLYDVESGRNLDVAPSANEEPVLNNWSHLERLNEHAFIQTTKTDINVLDLRQNGVAKTFCVKSSLECERITVGKLSARNANHFCFASTHNFQVCDVRYLLPDKNPFVKRWSHALQSPPLFLSQTQIDDRQIFYLSGERSNESCLIVDSDRESILPWHPPTIHDSLHTVRKKGRCLDPVSNVKGRISHSIVGHVFDDAPTNSSVHSYALNSTGDVFSQTMHSNKIPIESADVCSIFDAWSERLPVKQGFWATDCVDLTATRRKMANNKLGRALRYLPPKPVVPQNQKDSWKGRLRWMSECTDILAQDLFNFWELNPEDLVYQRVRSNPAAEPGNVADWLSQQRNVKFEYE